jgi:UDP-GlcNAc:undecaprenyl-phosphate/decaprenyl-phosphate GlcNAc-1-phosphate transferase
MPLIFPYLIAALIICLLIISFAPLAKKIGLVDHPGARKQHTGVIPLIGGIVIAISLFLSLLLLPISFKDFRLLFFGLGVLTIVGALDDQKEIRPNVRIFAQLLVAIVLTGLDHTVVTYVGTVLGGARAFGLGYLAIPFSVIAIVGTINAYNMIDGHDGLAGVSFIISLSGILFLIFFRATPDDQQYIAIVVLMIVLVSVFLLFNIGLLGSSRKIFLGDAGSMLFGLIMVFLLIRLSQRPVPVVTTAAAAWLVGLPLLDMVAVILRRLSARTSLVRADRAHIHHFLSGLGYDDHTVLFILSIIQLGFVIIGVFGTLLEWSDGWLFWGTFLVLGLYLTTISLTQRKRPPH